MTDSYFSHGKFFLVNNALRECDYECLFINHCLKFRKNIESKNPNHEKKKKKPEKIMISLDCAICGSKKSIFIKEKNGIPV